MLMLNESFQEINLSKKTPLKIKKNQNSQKTTKITKRKYYLKNVEDDYETEKN